MGFVPKTWHYDEIVTEQDFNRIELGIKEAIDSGAEANEDLKLHEQTLGHIHWIGNAGGTANALTGSKIGVVLVTGLGLSFKAVADSAAATTLNFNGQGDKPIRKANGGAVNNLKNGGIYTVRFDGTVFILQGEGGEYGTATAADVLTGKSIGTENGLIVGTMPNRGAQALTPSVSNQPIASGYHNGNGYVIGDTNLASGNIKNGVSIFGVQGNLVEKQVYRQQKMFNAGESIQLDMAFTPTTVIVVQNAVPRNILTFRSLSSIQGGPFPYEMDYRTNFYASIVGNRVYIHNQLSILMDVDIYISN